MVAAAADTPAGIEEMKRRGLVVKEGAKYKFRVSFRVQVRRASARLPAIHPSMAQAGRQARASWGGWVVVGGPGPAVSGGG